MDEKELYAYKMTMPEAQKRNMLKKQVLRDCRFIAVPLTYADMIEKKTDPADPYCHQAGYNEKAGCFFVSIGDRGAMSLRCLSQNPDDIRWYLLEEIITVAGQQMELDARQTEEQNWRYKRTYIDGALAFDENKHWTYNAIHDTRKFWFEYAIRSLRKVFDEQRLFPYVNERIDLMNTWFDQPHWDFDWQKMCFVEISNSQERC